MSIMWYTFLYEKTLLSQHRIRSYYKSKNDFVVSRKDWKKRGAGYEKKRNIWKAYGCKN